jgi:signal transduction histidine kinase
LEFFARDYPRPLDDTRATSRAIATRSIVEVRDVLEDPGYSRELAKAGGWRRTVAVPMMRGDHALGVIAAGWADPGPVPQRLVALLKIFADQAVIAIENVRLFNEIRESLEQQKASGEVLGVISSSIADTAPVFDKILESCQRLFAGTIVGLNLVGEDGMMHIGAYHGAHREEFERIFPIPIDPASGSGLAIVERRVVHYPDAASEAEVPARTRQGCKAIGIKSVIFAPVLWEGRGLGAIFVGRDHVSSFSEKEIALLRTFADQAAIAIENARLFREIQDKGRQLEIASRHKSEFLANMSHELRTPLNAIIGFTRIVMRRSKEQLETLQYENLEKILASGQHLLALINSILDLSKIEAGRVEVHPGHVGLAPVLEQCARTVEPLVKTDAVTLVKEFDGALPEMYVDEEKLRQIVINLLSNAVKFTERGTIRLHAQAANGSVSVAVADTGIGIAADKLDLIFEEFEQADASSTRVYGGTGLGLAIARRLARIMGGDIRAQSTLGGGSTFTLTLPVRYAA